LQPGASYWRRSRSARCGIDVIWPEILADNLLDLKAYIPEQEVAAHFPELIANNTVNGRLVALPSYLSEGLLFYRVDLLRVWVSSTAKELASAGSHGETDPGGRNACSRCGASSRHKVRYGAKNAHHRSGTSSDTASPSLYAQREDKNIPTVCCSTGIKVNNNL
jgi:hypothetical protein